MVSSARSSFRSAREQRRETPAEAAAAPLPLAGAHVLVVDDEFLIALQMEMDLRAAGAEIVGPAYTLESAEALAEYRDVTAAVLDIQIGHDSIAPVARMLAARGIPFLFYTGQIGTDPIRTRWPDCFVVSKPASPQALIAAVARLLRR